MTQTGWLIVTLGIMTAGFLGTFLPFLPGISLVYAGYIVYGLASGWKDYGWAALVAWGFVTVGVSLLDFYSGSIGAKKYGASRYALLGAIAGGILGLIVGGFLGVIVGPFVGAVVGELIAGKSRREALRSGWGTIIGFFVGSLLKIAVAVAMIGTFLFWTI